VIFAALVAAAHHALSPTGEGQLIHWVRSPPARPGLVPRIRVPARWGRGVWAGCHGPVLTACRAACGERVGWRYGAVGRSRRTRWHGPIRDERLRRAAGGAADTGGAGV